MTDFDKVKLEWMEKASRASDDDLTMALIRMVKLLDERVEKLEQAAQ